MKSKNLLRPFTERGGRRKAPRRVAWYCLSEILRAGATETGLVDDGDVIPDGIDIVAYRATLTKEAVRLLSLPAATLPWYLKQQALLFLAATAPDLAPLLRTGNNPETKHYRELILFLRGEADRLTNADFVTLAILARGPSSEKRRPGASSEPALHLDGWNRSRSGTLRSGWSSSTAIRRSLMIPLPGCAMTFVWGEKRKPRTFFRGGCLASTPTQSYGMTVEHSQLHPRLH